MILKFYYPVEVGRLSLLSSSSSPYPRLCTTVAVMINTLLLGYVAM